MYVCNIKVFRRNELLRICSAVHELLTNHGRLSSYFSLSSCQHGSLNVPLSLSFCLSDSIFPIHFTTYAYVQNCRYFFTQMCNFCALSFVLGPKKEDAPEYNTACVCGREILRSLTITGPTRTHSSQVAFLTRRNMGERRRVLKGRAQKPVHFMRSIYFVPTPFMQPFICTAYAVVLALFPWGVGEISLNKPGHTYLWWLPTQVLSPLSSLLSLPPSLPLFHNPFPFSLSCALM